MLAEVAVDPYCVDRDQWHDCAPSCDKLFLTIVVLGATGDLAAKKTFPSLAALYNRGFLPVGVDIIGFGRSDTSDEQLRIKLRQNLPGSEEEKDKFLSQVTYHRGQYDKPEGFQSLQQKIATRESASCSLQAGRLFYLALPPTVYPSVMTQIKNECSKLMISGNSNFDGASWLRVVVEKPFGRDLESSEELANTVASLFSEEQVYRIDHFLGKELSQNMLVMRFTNQFMSAIWDRSTIDNIQIVMKEDFGTQGRGGYFDKFGIIRDVIQNHLLQMLALLTMERPVTMHPDDIRDEKTKVIRSMRVVRPEDVVVAQYTAAEGQAGYLDDEGVPADSNTATYAVCRMFVENERWEGVPMLIKAGKAMDETKMLVRVQFKSQAGFFGEGAAGMRNEFVMQLKPKEAMYLKMVVKKPGLEMEMAQSELNLTYKERFDEYIPEAYERLILDAVHGNQQHFVRRDELRASWALFTPILHALDKGEGPELHKYPYGSRGVEAGDKLIEDSGYIRSSNYSWQDQKGGKPASRL